MSSKGLIYLYDSDSNQPIAVRKYLDKQKRKKIIVDWKKRYANAFYRCYIIISPEVSDNYDFDAMERQLDSQIPISKPTTFERPKAEYKGIYNTESPYGKYDI